MVVRPTGHDVVPFAHQCFTHGLRVGHRLQLIGFELWGPSLLESDRNTCDDVVVRTALQRRKDGRIDSRLEVLERFSIGPLTDAAPVENES